MKCICVHCKMYLTELIGWNNFFLPFLKYICLNTEMYLCTLKMYLPNWLVLADMGRSICKIYLSQFWIVFVYIVKCIWLVGQQVFVVNLKKYLFKHWNLFVHIEKCIWPNWLVLADMGGSVWANVSSGSVLLRRIACQIPDPSQSWPVHCILHCYLHFVFARAE